MADSAVTPAASTDAQATQAPAKVPADNASNNATLRGNLAKKLDVLSEDEKTKLKNARSNDQRTADAQTSLADNGNTKSIALGDAMPVLVNKLRAFSAIADKLEAVHAKMYPKEGDAVALTDDELKFMWDLAVGSCKIRTVGADLHTVAHRARQGLVIDGATESSSPKKKVNTAEIILAAINANAQAQDARAKTLEAEIAALKAAMGAQ